MNIDTRHFGAVTVTTDRHGVQTLVDGEARSIPAYLVAHTHKQITTGKQTAEAAWLAAHKAVGDAQLHQSSLR